MPPLYQSLNLRQYLLIFRVRWKLALAITVAAVALAAPVILLLPKQYTASTTLGVEIKSPDPITMLLMPTHMATLEEIIRSERVMQNVVRKLALAEDAALRSRWQREAEGRGGFESWLHEDLQRKLTVVPSRRDGNSITIEFRAPTPARAAGVANAFGAYFAEAFIELKTDPVKQYARKSGEQGKELREAFEAAQARLFAFQREKGIGIRDAALEAESQRLAQLAAQLTAVQAEAVDARSKQRAAGAALPELALNSVVQGLRADIARQEAQLRENAGNLGARHPQYRAMQAELAELKSRLEAETRHVARGYGVARSVSGDKEREIKAALETQRRKLLEMRADREQLVMLQRDVDAAKASFEHAERRFAHTSLEAQATQSNVFVIKPAVEPLDPSFPKVGLYLAASLMLGAMLGLATVHTLEMLDRRVRCIDDLAALLKLPVLGVIEREAVAGALTVQRRDTPLALPR